MNRYFEEFEKIINQEDKDTSVNYVMNLLNEKLLTLEQVYTELLVPAQNTFFCKEEDKELCIWKEHTRTSIIRTILECTYPFVVERRKQIEKVNKKVVILTPSEEYHEIGAIIVNNYFLLAGFNCQYIGANTPKNDILLAIKAYKPDYVALSVTNYYNIVVTKKIAAEIRKTYPDVKIIIGGQAFLQQGALEQVEHDYYLNKASDVFSFPKGN